MRISGVADQEHLSHTKHREQWSETSLSDWAACARFPNSTNELSLSLRASSVKTIVAETCPTQLQLVRTWAQRWGPRLGPPWKGVKDGKLSQLISVQAVYFLVWERNSRNLS